MSIRSCLSLAAVAALVLSQQCTASIDVTIDGSDAIFLAGRTDVLPIPSAPAPFILARHGFITPENILETLPPSVSVGGGDVVTFSGAAGGVSYFIGGPPIYGPSGSGVSGSSLLSLDGISGYTGPEGPIVGLFLDDAIPSAGPAPSGLDFTPGGLGTDFPSLAPLLGQVFYVGDGLTGGGVTQTFTAPTGATRLFLGIADGFGFVGPPGAYEDNDGAFSIKVHISPVPEPASLALWSLLALGAVTIGYTRTRSV